ncbi:MAG: L-histidine N(alpha)-methyltransferase [bacterium]
MDFHTLTILNRPGLKVKISRKDHSGEPFAQNVLHGLSATPKKLSPKYLYDETGSNLFEQICELPEYYPTRTERAIIKHYADQIASLCDRDVAVIELGSGSSRKTRLFIDAFLRADHKLHYLPVDISKSMLVNSAKALLKRYPKLRITALVSDYFIALSALKERQHQQKLILFLGSSIGNFEKDVAEDFFKRIRATMNERDMLLIGMDLLKSEDILVPAYDDAQGVTAAFNLNLLTRMNRELGANFDLANFRHKINFNQQEGRIEMHLESLREQRVRVGQLQRWFNFAKGETIHTENSYKYTRERICEMAQRGGLRINSSWYDEREWFSLNLMSPA